MSSDLVVKGLLGPVADSGRRARADKVGEKVARRILRDCVAEGLPPGARLPSEAVMSQRYAVGRASLREALRILETYGLIWIKPGPGGGPVLADVNSLDFGRSATFFYHAVGATLHELVETRLHLEPLLARLAAERLNNETAAMLRLGLEEDDATLREPRGIGIARSDRFHNVVAGMSGNPVMSLFGQSITDIYLERIRPVFPDDQREIIHATHTKIGNAILAGQASKAEKLMRGHVQHLAMQFATFFGRLADETIDWR